MTEMNEEEIRQGSDALVVRGAREHNLRDIDVTIPRESLTVVTGLSGSGKSSLAFDTIYAEGQRRYVESLSAYARQFLGVMEKPDVDQIEGLSPAIAIEQRGTARNPRSTVGTVTEVYDYLRLLWARAGTPHCPDCGKPVRRGSPTQIAAQVAAWPEGERIEILAPMVRGRKGEFKDLFTDSLQEGFVRARVDGELIDLSDPPSLNRRANHDISVVIDRLVLRSDGRQRIAESVETALRMADGTVEVVRRPADDSNGAGEGETGEVHLFSEHYACPSCGLTIPELEPRQFSFNSPYGACPSCDGMGVRQEPTAELSLADPRISILEGVLMAWGPPKGKLRQEVLPRVAEEYGFHLNDNWGTLEEEQQNAVLYGDPELEWEGYLERVRQEYEAADSDSKRRSLQEYMEERTCPECEGGRLKAESRAVTVAGAHITEVVEWPIDEAWEFVRDALDDLEAAGLEPDIAGPILKEVGERLRFLLDVGLGYLTLARSADTLAGGEAQRIRLATQIGSQLVGVLYVLDEPSIGLHARDNARLLGTLEALRDLGNTVLVVEHDEETIRSADHIVDLGPGAGRHGGRVIVSGGLDDLLGCEESLTGAYLRRDREIALPDDRRRPDPDQQLVVRGARQHNLQDIDVAFPLGTFIAVTGVSGSGKSTLVEDVLWRSLARDLHRAKTPPGEHDGVDGVELVDKVIDVDQSPIGRTPRSSPATYTGVFDPIRQLYSKLPESRMRGYEPGRFSFNVKGGRCESCKGDGLVKIEMHFLPDVYVPCDVCRGKRYNRETLEILYKGRTIADVLEMTAEEAREFFDAVPRVASKLQTMVDVGLGYITLGQSSTTLSGGEAQRVKLATELSKRQTGSTVYILDEPTTGLHFEDIRILLDVLHRLVELGNTVIVIEHHLDVVKTADHVIDLGPEGGHRGGSVVATGTPEEITEVAGSHTGRYLKEMLRVPAAV